MGILLGYLLFFTIVVAVIVLIAQKKSTPRNESNDDIYAQGYWDGYRALSDEIRVELEKTHIDKEKIESLIARGYGGQAPQEALPASKPTAAAVPLIDQNTVLAQKEQASVRNSNLLLYMASFLIVAAGATFIGAAVPDSMKLIGLGAVFLGFYGVGLALYRSNEKLRPAAVAFTGTGLALLPFFGVALHQYGGISPDVSWFLTSAIGMILYYLAAITLRNQVISYLTMAFVLSLVASSVAVISLPIVWYFIAIIASSLIASCIAFLKPRWVPRQFSEPIERTGQIVTPIALVASLSVYGQLSLLGYELIFGLATAHYLVAWLHARQELYVHITRIIGHMWLLIVAWDISRSVIGLGVFSLVFATGQIALSLFIRRHRISASPHQLVWIITMMSLQVCSFAFWIGDPDWAIYLVGGLLVSGLSGVIVGYLYRLPVFGIVPLAASVLVPIIYSQYIVEPAISTEMLAGMFAVAAGISVGLYRYIHVGRSEAFKLLIASFYLTYIILSFLFIFSGGGHGVAAVVLGVLTLLGVTASWIYRQPGLLVLPVLLLFTMIVRLWLHAEWEMDWMTYGSVIITAAVCAVAAILFFAYEDFTRYRIMLGSALVTTVCAGLIGVVGGDSQHGIAGGIAIIATGALLALEAGHSRQRGLMEAAVYIATLGLQYIALISRPELTFMLYGNWWAVTVLAVAIAREQVYPRLYIALGIASFTSAMFALGEGGGYSLFFLIEHLLVLVIGALTNKSWAIWWGIIASSLAVLYFLRDIAYLAFAFLGLLLIAFVVWRLTRQSSHKVDKK